MFQLYLKTQITDGRINADITFENQFDVTTSPKSRSAQARASISDIFKNTLGTWNAAGKPEYLDNNDKIVIDDKLKKYISTFFPENKNNTSSYVADDADILIKEDADIVINYFGGTTGAQSVFAYYCYPENASKEDIGKASQNACIIFPNAHSKALGDYSGVGVKLRYINPSGVLQSSDAAFPAGTKVGFLIWNNGWTGGNNGAFSNNVFYSTKSLNKDNISHTALFSATNKEGKAFNVITMEDWKGMSNTEPDYNDVAFTITSNPREAIDLPPLPDPDENISGSNTYRGLLGYEDNWPKQGDYDMNDVVMKYISTVTYNSDNKVVSIIDKFTLAWTGANYQNGFAYEVPFNLSDAIVSVSGGNNSSVSGNVIQLFTNAKSELGVESISAADMPSQNVTEKTYTVSIQFRDRTLEQGKVQPPYNPFIKRGRTEIHLTNQAPTANADNQFPSDADISTGNGTYYICKDGYPFAIHLDARTDEGAMNLNLKAEGVRIDETYEGFAKWAETRNPQDKWW